MPVPAVAKPRALNAASFFAWPPNWAQWLAGWAVVADCFHRLEASNGQGVTRAYRCSALLAHCLFAEPFARLAGCS